MTIGAAVAEHVHAGDTMHPIVGHTRWTAATREVVRQWWGRDPGFTLAMLSLSSLGALFFRGGLVRKVITGYSGDTFPNFTPNPWFADGVRTRRGRGRALVVPGVLTATRSRGRGLAGDRRPVRSRDRRWRRTTRSPRVDTPFGEVGLLAPLVPDVTLMHALVADREGNVACIRRCSKGCGARWRRGAA